MVILSLFLKFVLFCLTLFGFHPSLVQSLESKLEKCNPYLIELTKAIENLMQ